MVNTVSVSKANAAAKEAKTSSTANVNKNNLYKVTDKKNTNALSYAQQQPENPTQYAYEQYLTTGQIEPKYTKLVSFDDLEAFGEEHTHKLRDGRYFYSYEDTAIMDGYRFDKDAVEQAKSLFDDYWEKTGSQSAKWGYDLTNPEDYQRYMDGRPSLKYEAGYGDDAYSLWLKENGLGHADFFMNDGGTGYYDKALFDVAETRKQEQETADFMKEVKSHARYLAEDPTAITMDELYAAAQDVQSSHPEWRHFDLENPGTAKKTIEDFQDSASPDLAYQEYLDGLDKNRGKYGYIYMDELYSSVTGKPYIGTIDGSLAEKSSSSSSSSSSAKNTAAEEQLYSAAAEWLVRSGKKPTAENIDEAVSRVIESDTTGIFDDLKFVEEKDYSDSTWGSVSATRDKAKGITLAEATEGIKKVYEDWAATEITPPDDYVPLPENKKPTVADSELQKAIDMVEEYRESGKYEENTIKVLVEGKDLPYNEAIRYIALWEREQAKKESLPAPSTAMGMPDEEYEVKSAVDSYHRQAAEAARQDAKVSAELEKKKEQASSIIDEAIEETKATTHRTRVREYSVDVAIDRLINDMGLSFEEATALMREDGRLDYRDSTHYKETRKEQEEKIQAIAESSSVYQSYLAKEKELRQGNNQDIQALDSVKAATEVYAALRDLGLTNAQIEEQMALHGLRIEDAEGVVPDGTAVEAPDDIHEITSAAKQRERDAIYKAENAVSGSIPSVTFGENGTRYGVGSLSKIPVFDEENVEEKLAEITPAVDDVITVLIESKGYTREQAFSIVENYTTLKLSDSERYKERIDEYLTNKEVQNGDYSEAVGVTISDIIYRNTAKTDPVEKKREELDMFHGAAAEELYPKVLEAAGGDEALAVYYMGTLGLDATKVAQFVREERAAAEAETARVQKEADEDALMAEVFGVDDMEYYVDPKTFVISPETASPELTARVVEYRAKMKERGASDFDVDNALRRNGLGDIVSIEESGEHFMADVLREGGLDPELADAVAASYDAETKAEYGKNARYAENWEDSTDDVVLNSVLGAFVGGAVKVVNGALGFADMVTGDSFESIDDAIDFCNELQGKVAALAADQNHPLAAKAFEIGSEVVKMAITSKVSALLGKASKSIGLLGKSKVVDFVVGNFPFVSSAMGSYYDEAKKNGATNSDAATFAIFSGAMEGITERSIFSGKVIPSISSWIEGSALKSALKTSVKSAILRFGTPALNMALTAIGEGYEEGLSAFFSGAMRSWTWDDHFRIDGKQVAEDAVMGMAVGLIFGAFSAPANSRRNQTVMQTYELFKAMGDSIVGTTPTAQTAPTVPIDDLAAVTAVETEISPAVWEKYKAAYETGLVAEISDEEFSKAYALATTTANKSKQESRRYSEKTADYESQVSNAQKAVDSVVHQLKSLQDSIDKRGDGKYTIDEAKSFKSLVDSLMVKERDLERATAAAKTGRAAADEEYAGNAGKIKSDYTDAVKTVREWFMQRALKMDLQLFGEKAEPLTEKPATAEPATAETQPEQPAEIEVEQAEQDRTPILEAPVTQSVQTDVSTSATPEVQSDGSIPDFAVGSARSMYDPDDTNVSKVSTNTYSSIFDEGKRALYQMDDMEYMRSREEASMQKAMDQLKQLEWSIQHSAEGRDSVLDRKLLELDSGHTWGANDLDFAMGLLRMLDSEGDVSRVRELAKIIQEHGTVGGQFIQAFAKYSRTKEGMMLNAQKNAKKAEEAIAKKSPKKKKKIDDETKKAKESTKRATKEASKAISEEIERNLGIYDIVGDAAQRLEKKIKKALNSESKESVDVAKKIANDLFGVAKESPLPENQRRTKDTIEEAAEAYRRSEQYRQVWEAAKNMVYDEFSENEDALAVLRDYFENDGRSPISEEKQKAVLMRALKEKDAKLSDLIESFDKHGVSAMGDVIDYLMNRSAMNVEAATLMASDIMDRFMSMRAELAEKYLQNAWKDGKARDLNKLLANMRAVNFDSTLIKDAVLDANGIPVVTDADIDAIRENMEKAEAAQEAAKNGELYEGKDADYMARVYAYKAAEIVASKEPVSSRNEKLRAVSYMNMLLNVKTNVKNAASNVPMGILETVKDLPGTFIDKRVSKKLGTKRTTTAFSAGKYKQYMSGFKTGIREAASDIKYDVQTPTAPILDDVDATTMHGRYGGVRRNPFDDSTSFGKAANRISRLTGQVMSLGDRGFARGAYEGRIAELESLGYDVTDQKVMESAMLYALDRTFQNNSELAKRMEKVRRTLGIVGDMMFPFVQTPANVADKLMDYAGIGFIKAALQWKNTAGTDAFDQKLFVDRVSRSFTGAGVMLLGASLLKHGLITKEPEEWEEKQAMQNAGVLSYAIRVGDGWQTIDWADPTSALLLMGAFIGEGRSWEEVRDLATVAQAVVDVGKLAVNVLFSNSFLSSIAEVIEASDAGDAAEDLTLGYSSRFTPSALAQVAQIMDSVERDTSADTEIGKTVNYLMSRIPFLRETLPVKIGTDGKVVENKYGDSVGMRAFNALLNPGNYSKQSDDPVNSEIYRLYEEGFSNHLLPSSPYKVGNVTLTAEQRREYQAGLGGRTYAAAEKVMNGSSYKNADDEKKAELLEEAISSAEKKYKSEFKKTLK